MTQNKFIDVAPDYRLAITEHHNPSAKITGIILHGFQSSRQGNSAIVAMEALAAAGMSAVSVDFHAHGDSSGAFKDLSIAKALENVKTVIDYIHVRDPQQKIILIGGSFGGLIAQYAAVKFASHVIGLVLRAPVSDWWNVWHRRMTPEMLQSWRDDEFFNVEIVSGKPVTLGLEMLDDIQRQDIYTAIALEIRVPVLIVHGTDDETVPFNQSLRLHDVLPNSQLVTLNGADHRFSNPDDLRTYGLEIQTFVQALKK